MDSILATEYNVEKVKSSVKKDILGGVSKVDIDKYVKNDNTNDLPQSATIITITFINSNGIVECGERIYMNER